MKVPTASNREDSATSSSSNDDGVPEAGGSGNLKVPTAPEVKIQACRECGYNTGTIAILRDHVKNHHLWVKKKLLFAF